MIGRKTPRTEEETSNLKGFDDYALSLGDVMRGERATLNKSLLDVQRELRIKAPYIVAIENADPAVFDTPGFIAGYVRSYSRYLGLDPDWAFHKFCEESGFSGVHGMQPEASSPRPGATAEPTKRGRRRAKVEEDPLLASATALMPQRPSPFEGMNAGALGSFVVLAGLIGMLGYGGYSILQEVQRVTVAPVDAAPVLEPELDPLSTRNIAQQSTVTTDVVTPSQEALGRLYRPKALDAPILVARDGPIGIIDPETVGVWRAPAAPSSMDIAIAEATAKPVEPVPPVQVVAPPPPVVAIVAQRPAWVRVRAADNTILLEKILDAGESFVLPNSEEPATLRAGNSGDVYFLVDGDTFGPAGAPGAVASNVVLSRETLSTDFALADLDGDADLREVIATAEARILDLPPDPDSDPEAAE
ncbi:helix-turn-helix domain-containing protein [Dinoroseobacter sp. S76]|uniref:helix-turn-helix domain-containing protein n=1 Tax=Dinoroseobacter sp. S76 TaxID=3415124 RepID=UPI003C7B0409